MLTVLADLLAAFKDHPETIELNMHDVAACKRMKIDRASYEQLIDESEHEIDTLRQALGRLKSAATHAAESSTHERTELRDQCHFRE